MTDRLETEPTANDGDPRSDRDLLREYVERRSQQAFAALVERHLSLVYFAALRRTQNTGLAEDVAQEVFTSVAQKATSLAAHATLAGWLFTATRYAAAQKMRSEEARRRREQETYLMNDTIAGDSAPEWERLRPVIDAALEGLNERDREAVLLRFFAGQAFGKIGATLSLSEDAARRRVDRALDKLRDALMQRGVTSTGAALAAVLTAQGVAAAPAGLAVSIASHAVASATFGGGVTAAKLFGFMSTTKVAVGVAGIVVAAATAFTFQQRQVTAQMRAEVGALRQQVADATALREENRRLQQASAADASRLEAEHGEVLKLRGELDTIKRAIAAAKARMAANATNPLPAAAAAKPGDVDMYSVEVMRNVGSGTPNAAAQSLVWGMQHADVKTVAGLLRVESPEKEKLEALITTLPPQMREEYGTPEQLIAMMMCGTPRPLAAVSLLGEDKVGDDEVVHHVQMKLQDGEVRRDDVKFKRVDDSWKQVVSASTVDRVIAYVQGKK